MLKKVILSAALLFTCCWQPVGADTIVLGDKTWGLSIATSNIWEKVLANNYGSRFYHQPSVKHQLTVLRRRIPDLQHSINNATPYIAYIYAHAEAMHVPRQFALLPLIESDYNPLATNRSGAGLWQLERATARYMKIPVNERYDGRRDLVVSTHAALLHLRDLYHRFHDWELAAAAYNCGSGPVRKAINRNLRNNKATNFWAIRSQLPRITQAYVPRLAAMSYLLSHAAAEGLDLPSLSVHSAVGVVVVKRVLTLQQISRWAHVSVKLVKKLNPALVQGKTPSHFAYNLVLPASAVDHFKVNLKRA